VAWRGREGQPPQIRVLTPNPEGVWASMPETGRREVLRTLSDLLDRAVTVTVTVTVTVAVAVADVGAGGERDFHR
jgi:hypothetical protein